MSDEPQGGRVEAKAEHLAAPPGLDILYNAALQTWAADLSNLPDFERGACAPLIRFYDAVLNTIGSCGNVRGRETLMNRWLRQTAGMSVLLLGLTGLASAQQTGTVVVQVVDSAGGAPVRGAQVHVVGTEIGALTNLEGRAQLLNVPVGARTVRVQLLGYGARSLPVSVVAGTPATLTVRVRQEALALDALVVTALGVEKSERSLGYAVQSVTAAALERSPEVTLVSALSGQAAGISVTTASGRPGASARIVIRGETSFSGNGQPLFVIDGVPVSIDLDTWATTNNVLAPEQLDYGEAGSRMMDFDPNNIEEISVLRGAAATALYGSRAAAGAVIIKTKQGRPGAGAFFVRAAEVSFDRPILEGYVTDYAAGDQGYFCNGKLTGQGGWCQPGLPRCQSESDDRFELGPAQGQHPADRAGFGGRGPLPRSARRISTRRAGWSRTTCAVTGSIAGRRVQLWRFAHPARMALCRRRSWTV